MNWTLTILEKFWLTQQVQAWGKQENETLPSDYGMFLVKCNWVNRARHLKMKCRKWNDLWRRTDKTDSNIGSNGDSSSLEVPRTTDLWESGQCLHPLGYGVHYLTKYWWLNFETEITERLDSTDQTQMTHDWLKTRIYKAFWKKAAFHQDLKSWWQPPAYWWNYVQLCVVGLPM